MLQTTYSSLKLPCKILLFSALWLQLSALAHSILLCVTNRTLLPSPETMPLRIQWQTIGQALISISYTVYFFAFLFALIYFILKGTYIPLSKLLAAFLFTPLVCCLCTVPFAALEQPFNFNYLVPFYEILIARTGLYLLLLMANLFKLRHSQ